MSGTRARDCCVCIFCCFTGRSWPQMDRHFEHCSFLLSQQSATPQGADIICAAEAAAAPHLCPSLREGGEAHATVVRLSAPLVRGLISPVRTAGESSVRDCAKPSGRWSALPSYTSVTALWAAAAICHSCLTSLSLSFHISEMATVIVANLRGLSQGQARCKTYKLSVQFLVYKIYLVNINYEDFLK